MSKLFEYAVTVKKTRGKPTPSDYAQYLQWLEEKGFLVGNVNFEMTRGLHIHFVIKSVNKLKEKDPSLYRDRYGWNILAKKCYSLSGWLRYSEKDMKKPEVMNLMGELAEEKDMREAFDQAPEYFAQRNPYDPPDEESEEIIEMLHYPFFDIRGVSS